MKLVLLFTILMIGSCSPAADESVAADRASDQVRFQRYLDERVEVCMNGVTYYAWQGYGHSAHTEVKIDIDGNRYPC